jgi:protein phosphatase
MFALISDIHSNIEALTTVLADIEKRGIKTIYCLGDVLADGPGRRRNHRKSKNKLLSINRF